MKSALDNSSTPNLVKQKYPKITSKPEDICSKSPFKIIKKFEGFIDYKIIRKIHHKIQINASIIHSELGGRQHGILGLKIQTATYQTVIGQYFCPACTPQAAPVPANAKAAEIPRYIQLHTAQVDKWRQMLNAEDILKQQLLGSLEENCFKGQRQAYINYVNRTLTGLIQYLYDDHSTISPIDIEESEKKMNQEWSLLDPMVELFEIFKKECSLQKPLTHQSQ